MRGAWTHVWLTSLGAGLVFTISKVMPLHFTERLEILRGEQEAKGKSTAVTYTTNHTMIGNEFPVESGTEVQCTPVLAIVRVYRAVQCSAVQYCLLLGVNESGVDLLLE